MKKIFKLIKSFSILTLLILPAVSFAQDYGLSETAEKAGLLTKNVELYNLIGNILNIFLAFLGVIFVILILIAGFEWMNAGGNSDVIERARGRIANAIIGIIIIFSAYILTNFVLENLGKTTGVTPSGSGGSGGPTQQP